MCSDRATITHPLESCTTTPRLARPSPGTLLRRNRLYKRMAEAAASGLDEVLLHASLDAPMSFETPRDVQRRRYKFSPVAM